MKVVLLLGVISSVANIFLNIDNDPAFWGWLSSASWSGALLISELLSNK